MKKFLYWFCFIFFGATFLGGLTILFDSIINFILTVGCGGLAFCIFFRLYPNHFFKMAWVRKIPLWGFPLIMFIGVGFLPQLLCNHDYVFDYAVDATCTEKEQLIYKCQKCGSQEIKEGTQGALGHDIKTIITESTCYSEGIIEKKCSRCTEKQTEILQKKEHKYILVSATEPTCYEKGKKKYECSYCQNTKMEEFGLIKAPVVFDLLSYEMDFLGGVTHSIEVVNNTEKDIKYCEYSLHFYNAVGDIIYSNLDFHKGPTTWKITGPIPSGQVQVFSGYGFYNSNFNGTVSLYKVKITFMDDTNLTITWKDFEKYTDFWKG